MANKTTRSTTTVSKSGFLRGVSFFALVIAAFMFLFGGLNIFTEMVISVLNLIGQICVLIGIGVPAYDYTRGKSKGWKWVYWIALAVYVFGCVFGVIKGLS